MATTNIDDYIVMRANRQHSRMSMSEHQSAIRDSHRNPHPWKSNLRDMARMLNGDMPIPHMHAGLKGLEVVICPDCTWAFALREAYMVGCGDYLELRQDASQCQ